jgi:quercetin dioxygenase-like cupin family protein
MSFLTSNARSARDRGWVRPVVLSSILILGSATVVVAQSRQAPNLPGLTQDNVARAALAQFPGNDAVTFNGTFEPGATPGRHRHPGTEVMYVIDGAGVLLQDGRAPVQLKPGMTVVSEPPVQGSSFVHEVRNLSATKPLRTYIVLLIPKGAPPALPVN